VFIYSTGALEILHVSDPELVKDIGRCTPSELGKPNYLKISRNALFGGGLLTVNGDEWAFQRKLIAPEFFMDKIKVLQHSCLCYLVLENMECRHG